MLHLDIYNRWLSYPHLNLEDKNELIAIRNQDNEIKVRFGQELEFGTGGLRGIMGCGSNRINIYTIRKATLGLALYIKGTKEAETRSPSVVIAYDSRKKSGEFAREAALVLAENGIKAYLFDEITPTPILSFTVRELKATAGIVITASHNPPEYNGYKVYWSDGGQITDELAAAITNEIAEAGCELYVQVMDHDVAVKEGLLHYLGDEILHKYYNQLQQILFNPHLFRNPDSDLKIVYTPLHGAGYKPVPGCFQELGFKNILIVEAQAKPNGGFPTVPCPNPEEPTAFEMAIKLGQEIGADILMATDPDADRLGVAVKNEAGEYVILTGNQLGALMLEYILSQRKEKGRIPHNGLVIKTIVTSEMGRAIAARYGVDTIDTLTGFKYIGEKIKELNENGQRNFIFGFEESYGYLAGDFVRDKDAVQACLITAEMALYYQEKGCLLYQKLQEIFDNYGYYTEDLVSCTFEGIEGQKRIFKIMKHFRHAKFKQMADKKVLRINDYLNQRSISLEKGQEDTIDLPSANVLKYILEENMWFCIRPSGTEPKLKIYFGVCCDSREESAKRLDRLKREVLEIINCLL